MTKNNLAISVDPAVKLSKSMLSQIQRAIEFLGDSVDEIDVRVTPWTKPSITHIPETRLAVVALAQEKESTDG